MVARRIGFGAALVGAAYLSLSARRINLENRDRYGKHNDLGRELCSAALSRKPADCERIAKIYGSQFDPNVKHPVGGWSPLHIACANGDLGMVSTLIKLGANVNLVETPFTSGDMVLRAKTFEFSDFINPRARTNGFTPLHYAVIRDDVNVVKLDHDADPLATSCPLGTPLDFFDEEKQSPELGKLLRLKAAEVTKKKKQLEKELRRRCTLLLYANVQFVVPLEDQLRKAIVGQLGPINSVGSAIRRRENGWHDESRPLVFLFLGSSGIGKTELAKQLAKYLHKGKQDAFIRIDMSEFQSKHEVSKFIGSPPGFVGYEEGGQLTEKLEKCPDAIVLLDEVEKAHIDVLTIMLQVFDEGRLTDGKGKTIDCKNAIFIMTSNLAQQEIADEAEALREENTGYGNGTDEDSLSSQFVNKVVYPILREHFKRDEFLGRINETLFFLPFNDRELKEIVLKELEYWKGRAKTKHGIKLSWSDDVVEHLKDGYNLRYGARSIKHYVERKVVNQLAKLQESDVIKENSSVQLFVENGHIKVC